VVGVAGEGDRDRVDGALDQNGTGAGGQGVGGVGEPVQVVALAVGGGVGGVEVLRAVPVPRRVVVVVGVAAGDEPDDPLTAADG
jgi:hypothetical protein